MLNRTCIGMVVGVVTAVVMAGLSTARADVTFTDRQDVNLMDSYAVTVTPAGQVLFPGIDANNLRGMMDSVVWDGGVNPPGIVGDPNAPVGTNALTINFGTTRDIKTINLDEFPGSEGTAFTVETSPNGTSWTTQPATFTPNGSSGQVVLSSAVGAQYLRLVATDINDLNGNNRWVVNALRVLGDTGTLTDPTKTLDLVSGTGGPGGGTVTLSLNGSVSETATTDSQFVDDALYPFKAQEVLFNMGTGDGFTLHWTGTKPIDFDHVGLFFAGAGAFDPSATFTIETSMDGTSYTPALTQPGGLVEGMNYFTLSSINEGEYLRFTYTSTTSSDNRISDVQVFGDFVPEPASASLLAIGGLLTLRRKRR